MSAYVCDEKHWSSLCNHIDQNMNDYCYGALYEKTPEQIINILKMENVKSVNYRYNENTPFVPFDKGIVPTQLTTADFISALGCVHYQSCNSQDYYKSEAYIINLSLQNIAYSKNATETSSVWEIT